MSYAIVFKETEWWKQRLIQSKLFEQGFSWFGSNSKQTHEEQNYSIIFVYENEKYITRHCFYFSEYYGPDHTTYMDAAKKIVNRYHEGWNVVPCSSILNSKPMFTE